MKLRDFWMKELIPGQLHNRPKRIRLDQHFSFLVLFETV